MNTIINKKGNRGWTVGYWNTHNVISSGSRLPENNIVILKVRPVEVHSCGKKRMLLKCLDESFWWDNGYRGTWYDPSLSIYATVEDALQAAGAAFERILKDTKDQVLKSVSYYRERYAGDERKLNAYVVPEEQLLELLNNDAFTVQVDVAEIKDQDDA